uniref:DNA repair and recombination protein RAD54-like n=1 Tax=Strigamia maritima TaxID=126957 RepID=T1J2S8_STRMM
MPPRQSMAKYGMRKAPRKLPIVNGRKPTTPVLVAQMNELHLMDHSLVLRMMMKRLIQLRFNANSIVWQDLMFSNIAIRWRKTKNSNKMGDEDIRMKQLAESGRVSAALELAKSVYTKNPTEKLKKRIEKMERHIELYGEDSEDDEDEMVCLGNDFYLYNKLKIRLYSYQIDGVLFLWKLFGMKKGGVIADDMGLGKTIQVIAFLTGMFDMEHIKNVLIVLPLSLIPTWEKEFEEWAPGMQVFQYHGSTGNRDSNLNKVQRRGGVLLTTYGIARSQNVKLSTFYGKPFKWNYIILDEAHAIKNPTQTTKALHKIDSSNRIVLTGTPVQNNLRELWSLYDFVHFGSLLGSVRTFKIEYETPIVRSREKDATANQRAIGEKMAAHLYAKIQPYFLRRTKAQVLKDNTSQEQVENKNICKPKAMAQKNDFIVWLFLTPLQQKLYLDFLKSDEVKEILMSKKSPLVQLTVMKKICDHPRLLPKHACETLGFDNLDISMDISDRARSVVDKNLDKIPSEMLLEESNKISFTLKLVTELKRTGHRCLIFSLSRKLLNILQKVLLENGFSLLRLDGTISDLNDRGKLVDKFQTNAKYDLFLLTTKVGGVGLTLTAADRVIILDPSWNPAVDNQAVDRAFRIGQEKPVVIYRLITCSTIEEKIYRRQIFKEGIIRQANKDSQDPMRYFTKEELRSLFQLEDVTYSKTQKQLQDMHTGQRKTNDALDEHIAFLHSLGNIFGLSDHDLMFSHDDDATGEGVADDEFINKEIARVENKILKETEFINQLKENKGFDKYKEYTHKEWSTGLWSSNRAKEMMQGNNKVDMEVDELIDDFEDSLEKATGGLTSTFGGFSIHDGQANKENKKMESIASCSTEKSRKDLVVYVSDSEDEDSSSIQPKTQNSPEITICDSLEDLSKEYDSFQDFKSPSNKPNKNKRRSCSSVVHKFRALNDPSLTKDFYSESFNRSIGLEESDDDDDLPQDGGVCIVNMADSPIKKLLGDQLVRNNGDTVQVSSLSGVIALYFSAHWCPPCRSFTTELINFYKNFKVNKTSHRLEIVYVSADTEENEFQIFFQNMPWFSIPFDDKERKTRLPRKFGVKSIPALILIEADSGCVITSNGRELVADDPKAAEFPWRPRTIEDVLSTTQLISRNNDSISMCMLKNRIKGIYFSANWCPPCKAFTPQLIQMYENVRRNLKDFEIIFVSSDRSRESFELCYSSMPWLAIPFSEEKLRKEFTMLFGVQGIPSLVLLDEKNNIITKDGRFEVSADLEGKNFPWRPSLVNELTEKFGMKLNDAPCLVLFCEGDKKEVEACHNLLLPIAEENTHKDETLLFFVGAESEVCESLREFAELEDAVPLLIIVDIPEGKCYELEDDIEITSEIVRSFVDRFHSGQQTGRSLKMLPNDIFVGLILVMDPHISGKCLSPNIVGETFKSPVEISEVDKSLFQMSNSEGTWTSNAPSHSRSIVTNVANTFPPFRDAASARKRPSKYGAHMTAGKGGPGMKFVGISTANWALVLIFSTIKSK